METYLSNPRCSSSLVGDKEVEGRPVLTLGTSRTNGTVKPGENFSETQSSERLMMMLSGRWDSGTAISQCGDSRLGYEVEVIADTLSSQGNHLFCTLLSPYILPRSVLNLT